MKPITQLEIRDEKARGGYSTLLAKIDDHGALVLEGCDAGKDMEKFFGDGDFEYWLTIPAEFKDTVLLHLIKERFTSAHDMRAWLEQKGIPCEFTSY